MEILLKSVIVRLKLKHSALRICLCVVVTVLLALVLPACAVSIGRDLLPPGFGQAPTASLPAVTATHVPSTPSATANGAKPAATSTRPASSSIDLPRLQQIMLNLINDDRAANGLSPVAWDDTAARAGQAHTDEMVAANYLSHWNQAGYGPDHRYAFAGGLDADFENVHSSYHRYIDGRGVPVTDWEAKLADVEKGFMGSTSHRRNILDPAHTHVGIGIAYNRVNGELRVAQEFVNRYAQIDGTPGRAAPGASVTLSGRLLRSGLEPVLVSVAYEPPPSPLSVAQLNKTTSYMAAGGEQVGEIGQELANTVDGIQVSLALGTDAGLYHARLWVTVDGKRALAVDRILEVR